MPQDPSRQALVALDDDAYSQLETYLGKPLKVRLTRKSIVSSALRLWLKKLGPDFVEDDAIRDEQIAKDDSGVLGEVSDANSL